MEPIDSLPTDVESLHRGLKWLVRRLVDSEQSQAEAMAELRSEWAAQAGPLHQAVEELRWRLEQLSAEVASNPTPDGSTQQSILWSIQMRLDELTAQVADVARSGQRIDTLNVRIDHMQAEVESARHAALTASTEQLSAVARLRSLESMPKDMEDLYRELERVSEAVSRSVAEGVGNLDDRLAPVETRVGDLVLEFEQVAMETKVALQANLLASAREVEGFETRVRALESLGVDVVRLGAEVEGRDRDGLAFREQVEEALAALGGRLARLDSVPADLESVYREVDRIMEFATSSHSELTASTQPLLGRLGELQSSLAMIENRVLETETLPESIESLRSDLSFLPDRLSDLSAEVERVKTAAAQTQAEMTRMWDSIESRTDAAAEDAARAYWTAGEAAEKLADVQARLAGMEAVTAGVVSPLADTLTGVRTEMDRVAAEMRATTGSVVGDISLLERHVAELADVLATQRADSALFEDQSREIDSALRSDMERLSAALRDETIGVAEGASAAALTALAGRVEELGEQLELLHVTVAEPGATVDLGQELAQVAGHVEVWRELAASLSERIADLERLPMLVTGMGRLMQRAAAQGVLDGALVAAVEERLEVTVNEALQLGSEASDAVRAVAREVGELAGRVESIAGDARGDGPASLLRVEESLRLLQSELDAVRQAGLVDLKSRTSPLAEAVMELQTGMGQLLEEAAGDRDVIMASVNALDALAERTAALEDLPGEVAMLDAVVTRLDRDVVVSQQAALAAATYRLAQIDSSLRSLESLRADVDGLYGSLFKMAEEIGLPTVPQRPEIGRMTEIDR